MKKVLVSGCNGKMGQIICRLINEDPDLEVSLGIDPNMTQQSYPVYPSASQSLAVHWECSTDVVIDFSSPNATSGLIGVAKIYKKPIVIATTGISNEVFKEIEEAATVIPVFYSANMSYEIYVLQRILEVAVPLLKTADIEISEEHHNRKADSPSGTAKMLANTINKILDNEKTIVYGREGKRQPNEIGISAIRGGNVCGVHTIHFFGENDALEIKHTAFSRDVFAEGAIRAAKFLLEEGREPGLYSMADLANNKRIPS